MKFNDPIRQWKKRKAKKLEFLKSLVDIHRINEGNGSVFFLGHDRSDLDILSKRITNAFEYVTTVMAAHEIQFHTKAVSRMAPKKPAKKKRRTPEQINNLIKTIRKA